MGSQWLMWMLLLTSSSSVEGQPVAEGKSSLDERKNQDTLPFTRVESVTLPSPLLVTLDERAQTDPLRYLRTGCKRVNTPEKYLTDLVTLYINKTRKRKNAVDARTNMKEAFWNSQDIYNDENSLRTSTSAVSINQVLRPVERRELKEDDLAGEAVTQDLLLNPAKEVQVNTEDYMMKRESESPVKYCYLTLVNSPEYILNCVSCSNDDWDDLGRRRRRRRSPFKRDVGLPCRNCSLGLSLAKASGGDLSLVELVLYLISLTSGRQFYLVYDDVTPGVEDVVRRALQEVLGDTILLPYEPSLLLLTEVLTSNYQVHPMRNVFILCSTQHIVDIFKQVRERVLESPTIQWFVIVDQDMTEDVSVLLREGTQVVLAQRVSPQKARLFSSRVNPDGKIGFHLIGWWSVNGTWLSSNQAKGGLVPDLQQLYSDFQGRQLLVTTNQNWPFFKIEKLKNGTVLPISGIDLSLISTLGEKLNFTPHVITSPDGKWGGPKSDGTVTGIVGQVARHEAHVTLCELTITDIRESVIDFTMPYYLESMSLISPAPKERNRAFAILSPFTVEVWLYIFLVTVLMGPLLYTVSRLLVVYLGEVDGSHYSLQSFSFNMFRNMVLQGNLIDSHRWTLRFIFICWYLFCLYIYAMYSGTLTAALAVTSYEKPINSLYDLARAKRDGYTIATARDTNYEATFRRATTGIYKEVWQLFNHEDRDKSFLPRRKFGMDKVEHYRYVYISAQLGLRLEATQRGRHKFYIGRETFLPQGYGIGCSSGSPYKDVFSSVVIRLIEVGLVDRWTNDEVNKVFKFVSTTSSSGPSAISLQHLQAAFFIMALGFAASVSALFLEILTTVSWLCNKKDA